MSKHFRPWNIDQTAASAAECAGLRAQGPRLAGLSLGWCGRVLDLKAIMCSYVSGLGQPPFDPRMMVSLLLHGYASGLYSSRRIARACCERNDFVMIVALDPPDFRTISDFRKRHLKALGELFLQVLKLCETAGLTELAFMSLISHLRLTLTRASSELVWASKIDVNSFSFVPAKVALFLRILAANLRNSRSGSTAIPTRISLASWSRP